MLDGIHQHLRLLPRHDAVSGPLAYLLGIYQVTTAVEAAGSKMRCWNAKPAALVRSLRVLPSLDDAGGLTDGFNRIAEGAASYSLIAEPPGNHDQLVCLCFRKIGRGRDRVGANGVTVTGC